jgi:hypothetical protein
MARPLGTERPGRLGTSRQWLGTRGSETIEHPVEMGPGR